MPVNQLAKQAAELALQLAALPADGLRYDAHALDNIEQLAARILNDVSTARASAIRPIGEIRGAWRAVLS
jgi:hypothetical protein